MRKDKEKCKRENKIRKSFDVKVRMVNYSQFLSEVV